MGKKEIKRLDMKSSDIVGGNIEKIGNLFPNVIKEGKIDFNALKQELSNNIVNEKKEKYQFTWAGKGQAVLEANSSISKTLRPVKEKSVDFDRTKNIYIEGDNLETLKILQESYLNKIKCIYIDPPYNTGNDFVYNDVFNKDMDSELSESGQIDEYNNRLITNTDSNGRFHSDWLSMMYSRLKLARNLLTDDGVIFISIDDNEQANLKKICDEIFGESNFIDSVIWKKTENIKMDSKFLSQNKDYILIYRKSDKIQDFTKDFSDESRFKLEDEKGKYYLRKLDSLSSSYSRGMDYVIEHDGIKYYAGGSKEKYEERQKGNPGKKAPTWLWSKEKYEQGVIENEIVFKNGNVYNKVRFDGLAKKPFINIQKLVSQQTAQKDLDSLFEKRVFDHPKPTELVEWLIDLLVKNNDIVLDFFSGSATTAHAIMNNNVKNNKSIQYILVQLPEKIDTAEFGTICDLGEERIRRAGKKIKKEANADIDYGFRVFKVDSSNMKDVYYEPSKLNQTQLNMFESNIKEDRTSEDLLTQVILDLGLTLDLNIEEKDILNNKVYFVAENSLVACFDSQINIDILNEICEVKPLKVVFRESSFRNDSDKINIYERIKKLSPETEISVI